MGFSVRLNALICINITIIILTFFYNLLIIDICLLFTFMYLIFVGYVEILKPLRSFHQINNYYLENNFDVYISDLNKDASDIVSKLAQSFNKMSSHLRNYEEISQSYSDLVQTKKLLLKELEVRKALELSTEIYLQQLERMYENVEEFSYMTSHDLKAPLKTLVSFIELLCEDVEEDNKESINEDLHHIKITAARMDKIIGNILDISKCGISPLEMEDFFFRDMVNSVVELLQSTITEKNITILSNSTDIEIYADRNLIERVLQNLISNAIKFSPQNSEITLSINENEKSWTVSVQDFGIGIKKDELKSVFKPFNCLNSQNDYEGSGIGLSICEKIIERHGGRIWIDSVFGKGSTFSFTLSKELKVIYEQSENINH